MRIRFVLLLGLISMLSPRMFAQNAKTLLVDRPLGNDPITIIKVMEGTTELKSNGHQYPNRYVWESVFNAGDDWLKDLSFVIKNTSEKKIVYVGTGCGLYETADWHAELAKHATTPLVGNLSNSVGRRPEQALYSAVLGHSLKPDTAKAPFELAPEQEFTIALERPEDYPTLKSSMEERQPISSVTACNSRVGPVFFDDGTQWQGHRYLRADPDQPGHWLTMSFKEWSGSSKTTK